MTTGATFLRDLLRIPSVSGQEQEAMEFVRKSFERFDVEVETLPLSDALRDDPDYSSPIPDIRYDGRFNVRVLRRGRNPGRKLLFNAHVDVVPPSEGMDEPYGGRFENGVFYGRGACDNKGSVSALYRLLELFEERGVEPASDLGFHFVVEEENGGNGSLAMARLGEQADGCVVLEPTEGRVLTSIRGAVWFRITFTGVAGHSGQAGRTRSALLMAHTAISKLTEYHRDLLAASRGIALFDEYENPMPITFGRLTAGNWPASAPNRALLEGVLGFLPNRTKEQICDEMRQALLDAGLEPESFELDFTYRHDCSVTPPDGWLARTMVQASTEAGLPARIDAMPASCDAWFYNNFLGIPTVVFGPGTLSVAHSREEQIKWSDVEQTAEALFRLATTEIGE
jgi:acetylornithine deacetylase